MIHILRKIFCTPPALELAKRELEVASRELMEAQRGVEYHASMVDYHSKRICRLSGMLNNEVQK